MRGIISAGAYVPYWRLQRSAITAFHGGRGSGTRSVASYDEDTTTLGVEAARNALAAPGLPDAAALWFSTSDPTYLEKNNASAIHAALRLPSRTGAFDLGGSLRSALGALRGALESGGPTLVVAADIRGGLPNSADESAGGDGAAALLVGEADDVAAEYLGGASATEEFLDRWRSPGERRTKQWEEKFGETHYVALAQEAFSDALAAAGIPADDVDQVVIATSHPRAGGVVGKKLGRPLADDLATTIGKTGTAAPALLLTNAIESAAAGTVVALVSLADGADVLILRVTGTGRAPRSVAAQIGAGNDTLPYAKFLAWRGVMTPEPPRRPEPARMSGSAAGRSVDWKYGFVGSRDRDSGALHLPPARVSFDGGNVDDMEPTPMANAIGTVVTYTVDRLAYSPSPPVIFAVVDFDDGSGGRPGRLPVELTDTTPDDVAVGTKVEMTFRRLNTADGIANYFWKARPRREATS